MVKRIALLAALAALLSWFIAAPAAAQPPSVDAKIEIVWPHDGRGNPVPLRQSTAVNIEAYLFERGTLDPVACAFPNPVTLHWASSAVRGTVGFLRPMTGGVEGQRVLRTEGGRTFPVWIFNDVPAPMLILPGKTHEASYFYTLQVEGADSRSNVWAHAVDPRAYVPQAAVRNRVEPSPPNAVDGRIEVVWPHDAQGNPRSTAEGPLANIAVDLTHHVEPEGGQTSVGTTFNHPVLLRRALNNGFLEIVKPADEVLTLGQGTPESPHWPRWIFNDVDVSAAADPASKYYFAVEVQGLPTFTTIWTHGADARTYFPLRDIPARGCAP